jgi:hypothetical protein
MTASEAFNSFVSSLEARQRIVVLREIRSQCDNATRQVIYTWRSGKTRIRQTYRDKINAIAGYDVFKDVAD